MPTPKEIDLARINSLVNAHMTIPQEYLAEEAALMMSKWPAYRFMSPRKATLLFTIRYREAYKDTILRNSDRDEAERAQPAAKLDIFTNNSHFTQMWRARQIADELGVRYENYLEFCFDFAARRGGRRKPPQPNQLGPNKKTEEVWTALFGKMWGEARLLAFQRMEPMAQYALSHRSGLPAQIRFEEELITLGSKSDLNLEMFVAKHLVQTKQVSEAACRAAYGDWLVDAALERAASEIESGQMEEVIHAPMARSGLWQSCFGVVGIDHAASPICAACPQAQNCEKVRAIVTKQVAATAGSVDPLRERRLADQRRHTADCRARQKAKTASASRPVPAPQGGPYIPTIV